MTEVTIAAESKPLRQLTGAEFRDRYGCDRLTATILSSRFQYINEHVCGQLLTNAFSPIIKDMFDFNAALVGPPDLGYQTPAVARSLALFFASMRDAVANAVDEYGPENLRPGDVLISNDPYRNGTHVNDICFIRPVFWEGHFVTAMTLRAHMMDMGGIVPGGFTGTKRNVYETGLVIPPTLLYRDDQPVKSTFSLIFDNVRFANLLVLDIQSIYQSLRLGERLIWETIERYGVEAYRATMRYTCDVSADMMMQAIAAIPDGVYEGEDYIDSDAVDETVMYRIAARLRKSGTRIEVDFSGSSHQARTCINCAWPDLKTAVGVALKYLLDPMTPFTSGAMRPIDIVAPPGTVVTATPPDGAVMLYWEAVEPAVASVMRALSGALGEGAVAGAGRAITMHNATGSWSDGTPFANVFGPSSGWGANRAGDADSAHKAVTSNVMDIATEALEHTIPALMMRDEYVIDSAGPGYFRGGASSVKDCFWLEPCDNFVSNNHTRTPPGNGVYGGADGGPDGVWVWEPKPGDPVEPRYIAMTDPSVYASATPVSGRFDPTTLRLSAAGRYFHWGARPVWRMPAGAIWRSVTAGGGGWGDPLTRQPEAVRRDVRDGYVSVEGAARDYGVVITGDPERAPEDLVIDDAATARLRHRQGSEVAPPRHDGEAAVAAPAGATQRTPVDQQCPACGSADVRAYPVIGEDGWLMTEKCQACLYSLRRLKWRRTGHIELIEDSF